LVGADPAATEGTRHECVSVSDGRSLQVKRILACGDASVARDGSEAGTEAKDLIQRGRAKAAALRPIPWWSGLPVNTVCRRASAASRAEKRGNFTPVQSHRITWA
jgi:hypothetical protein